MRLNIKGVETRRFTMNTNINAPIARRTRGRIGPFTVVALVISAAFAYANATRPAAMDEGRIIYEADSRGRLQRVTAPSAQSAPPVLRATLWKPKVSFLLTQRKELMLSGSQLSKLQTLDVQWTRENTDWQRQLKAAMEAANDLLTRATPTQRASSSVVVGSLRDYSRLSQEYDLRRGAYWLRGMELLTSDQRRHVQTLTQPIEK